ncbi:adhesion G-protein coupled receptor G5-like [Astatotilapia calliptera]|nr:adhesion G-protein coupled receptor G5-like [Astatotilapia calliptera]
MTRLSWTALVLLMSILQGPGSSNSGHDCSRNGNSNKNNFMDIRNCFKQKKSSVVVDSFYGNINGTNYWGQTKVNCIVFVETNGTELENYTRKIQDTWPKIKNNSNILKLHISKWHIDQRVHMYVLYGTFCNDTQLNFPDQGENCSFNTTDTELCHIRCINTDTVCKNSAYGKEECSTMAPNLQNEYIIDINSTTTNCINCNNPVKKPEEKKVLNTTLSEKGGEIIPANAAKLMNDMSNLAANINGSSAEISVGEGVKGVLVKETHKDEVEEVLFAYQSPNDSINIIDNTETLKTFSRAVMLPKEAFDKAIAQNVSIPFAALFRFINMAKDEKNSTVLGNEVLAIEMGAAIANLTDKINIVFTNMTYRGIPSCHSWNGQGSQPNWTSDGCVTNVTKHGITCQCSHLTFFAILMTPLNETISDSDFKNLTIITQVGCGLSMFFLAIVLFMHFLSRRIKATNATKILINLVCALFLLNLTFLVNNYVANLNNSVGCKIMAALMHYFMLATFTWFAAQAFHLCLSLYTGGKIAIHRYILKIAITSWILPSVIGIVLLCIGKYGEQVISYQNTGNAADRVMMCWITDNSVHLIINIGYYALVFLFTFTTFIIMMSWLCCLRNVKGAKAKGEQSSINILSVMGLCFMLGITWGFAFFAYGVFQVPALYLFTILNSFQGFFLFVYYYKTSRMLPPASDEKSSSVSNITDKTSLSSFTNPYSNWLS